MMEMSDMYMYRPIPESECRLRTTMVYTINHTMHEWIDTCSLLYCWMVLIWDWYDYHKWLDATPHIYYTPSSLHLYYSKTYHIQDCDVGIFQNTSTCYIRAGLAWHKKIPTGIQILIISATNIFLRCWTADYMWTSSYLWAVLYTSYYIVSSGINILQVKFYLVHIAQVMFG